MMMPEGGGPVQIYVFRRREQKYLLNEAQKAALVRAVEGKMQPDDYGRSLVCNIYYDTPDYRLIRRSLEGPAYKEKLRLRGYGSIGQGDKVFLEMKKKYDGIVYKRRVKLPVERAMTYMADVEAQLDKGQIGRELDYFKKFYRGLRPTMYLSYDRLAWRLEDLRITLDWNVRYRTERLDLTVPPDGEQLLDPGQYLLEIKTASAMPLWLVEVLDQNQIRKQSFSKYGKAYLRLLQENKIESRGSQYV